MGVWLVIHVPKLIYRMGLLSYSLLGLALVEVC